jgi:hypothetical protein
VEVVVINPKCSIQVAFVGRSLLSLPQVSIRRIHGQEPLVDYLQSHVVISKEYLKVMRQKIMDREAIN